MKQVAFAFVASALGALAGSFVAVEATLHVERAARPQVTADRAMNAATTPPPTPRELITACASRELDSLRADLRKIVHDELADAGVFTEDDAMPGAPASAAAEPAPPEALEAERQAQNVVERATARHVWTNDDAATLRPLLSQLTPPQREDIMRELVPAMNDGRIKNQTAGAPF